MNCSTEYVLLFPGQGSQHPGMAQAYVEAFQTARDTLEEASDVLNQDMFELCLRDPHGRLNMTIHTQPAVLCVSTALHRVLCRDFGVDAKLVAGHSLGEYSALVALGAMSFSDALRTVRVRAQAMQEAVAEGTGMLAYIGSRADLMQDYCANHSRPDCRIEVANFNAPRQLVLSGHLEALSQARQYIDQQRLGTSVVLPVSAAFHSSLMEPAADVLSAHLQGVHWRPLQGTIVANTDATPYTDDEYSPGLLVRQAKGPVLWLQSLYEVNRLAPEATWLEVGPGSVLRGLTRKAFPGKSCIAMDGPEVLREQDLRVDTGQQAA